MSSAQSPNSLQRVICLHKDYIRVPSAARVLQLESAIRIYESLLRVMSQRRPELWAKTQNNLGIACAGLPRGDRGENLERAIA